MIINNDERGWRIEWQSTEEREALSFLFKALYEYYAKSVNWSSHLAGSQQANPEIPVGRIPETV